MMPLRLVSGRGVVFLLRVAELSRVLPITPQFYRI